jgi:uncharacterized membrane protein YphA (DoxX/SURF4 family)
MAETSLRTTSNSGTARILLILGRIALAGIFLFAAYAKLKPQIPEGHWSKASVKTSIAMFAMNVDSFQMLASPHEVSIVAHLLPFCELGLGLWLLTGILLRFSSITATLVLSGFFAMVVRAYVLGLQINCGCFRPDEKLGPGSLLRDGSLLALAIAVTVGAFLVRRNQRRDETPSTAPATQGAD